MKRPHEDEIKSGNSSNKRLKQSSILDQIVINPGLQHIIEMIFFNLDYKDLKKCSLVNKNIEKILINPMFWLKKWRFDRRLSKKNQFDAPPNKTQLFESLNYKCYEYYLKNPELKKRIGGASN